LSRQASASGKIINALAITQPNMFYRLSPEAARLTTKVKTNIQVM
jgi:hypothetical protein